VILLQLIVSGVKMNVNDGDGGYKAGVYKPSVNCGGGTDVLTSTLLHTGDTYDTVTIAKFEGKTKPVGKIDAGST
jgi:hypothetical protein